LILRLPDHLALRQRFGRARHLAFGSERGPHLNHHRDGSFLPRFLDQFLDALIEGCASGQLGGGLSLRFDGGGEFGGGYLSLRAERLRPRSRKNVPGSDQGYADGDEDKGRRR
jgi:hypothetical protein